MYVATGKDSAVYALSVDDGRVLWTQAVAGSHGSRVTVGPIAVYCSTSTGWVCSLDRSSGELLWRRQVTGGWPSPPNFAGHRLFLAARDGTVHAVSAEDGTELWQRVIHGVLPTPVSALETAVYVATSDGVIRALRADDGRTLWRSTVAQVAGSNTGLQLATSEGLICCRQHEGALYALSGKGELLWSYPGGFCGLSAPSVSGDVVYVTAHGMPVTPDHVFALRAADGSEVWRAAPRPCLVSAPATGGDTVFIGASGNRDHAVCALRSLNGQTIWSWQGPAGEGGIAGPLAAGGRVYVSVANDGLFALRAETGEVLWHALEGLHPSFPAASIEQ